MKSKMLVALALSALYLLLLLPFGVLAMGFDAETAYESIFVVYSGNSIGSGFAIGSNTVVSNAHVIERADSIRLYSYHGDVYSAEIYLIDYNADVAVLSVKDADFAPLEIGDCDALRDGDDVYAIGAPKSLSYTLTKGVISNHSRTIRGRSYIQIDAAINSGNSGGPLLNDDGQVIGITSMKLSDAEGIGLAIPISTVISFMENNGVLMSEDSSVSGELPFSDSPPQQEKTAPGENDASGYKRSSSNVLVAVLIVFLALSVLLNAILVIILVYQKNRNIEQPCVPSSDRTDFDIEILE